MILSGENAFYNTTGYSNGLKDPSLVKDFVYYYRNESKVVQKIKSLFTHFVFPFNKLSSLYEWAGGELFRSSKKTDFSDLHFCRANILNNPDWVVKRVTVDVNGTLIDAAIMGRKATIDNGRWMLFTNGNASFYEYAMNQEDLQKILIGSNSNFISFNYPGTGMSGGKLNRHLIVNTYRAMLKFITDKKNGLAGQEVICYGHSMGGGVQSDGIPYLPKNVKVALIKDRTYSDIYTIAREVSGKLNSFLLWLIGWNFSSIHSSKKHKYPELIIQSAKVDHFEVIRSNGPIISDGVLPKEATLAEVMLSRSSYPLKNKTILAVKEMHVAPLSETDFIANWINASLGKSDKRC